MLEDGPEEKAQQEVMVCLLDRKDWILMSQTPGKLIPGDGAVDNRAGNKNRGSPKALIQVVLPFLFQHYWI